MYHDSSIGLIRMIKRVQ